MNLILLLFALPLPLLFFQGDDPFVTKEIGAKVRSMSLASGGSNNCYYIGAEKYGVLIDAGTATRTIKKRLKEAGANTEMIRVVFVTHDHADHIKAVGGLGEKPNIPIYTTVRIHEGINKSCCMMEELYSSVRYLEKQQSMQLRDFHVESFEAPHDGTDNIGYCIKIDGKVSSFFADFGEITLIVAQYIYKADYLILEVSYDDGVLRMGSYPQYLKERITSRTGHMSNIDTVEFLTENITEYLQYIWLCHLSKDNDHPELAYETAEWKLREEGVIVGKNVQFCALEQATPSELYEFE